MDNTYELLMNLPLFSGVTHERMLEIVGSTKFHFLKYSNGDQFITAGDPCTDLKFIISGAARLTITSANGRFSVSQTLSAPDVIAPEYIFGLKTVYPCDAYAIDTVSIMQISKADYMKILNSDPIFLFNFLNLLSMYGQKSTDGVLAVATGSLEERIAFWVVALTQRGGKDITLTGRQRDLYSMFGVQRSSFIATLDKMKERGIIDYTSSEIHIPDRKALVDMLISPAY